MTKGSWLGTTMLWARRLGAQGVIGVEHFADVEGGGEGRPASMFSY
jgi:hypothetical protein